MAVKFNEIVENNTEHITEFLSKDRLYALNQVCDTLQFENPKEIKESAIVEGGYFKKGFYMFHPFYYLDRTLGVKTAVINGALILPIQKSDLKKFDIKRYIPKINEEVIEHIDIVLLENHHDGIYNQHFHGGAYAKVDLAVKEDGKPYDWRDDTYEYIGVFRAKMCEDGFYELVELPGSDRFYFDKSKLMK